MSKIPLTQRGADKLREELKYRKGELRQQIIKAIDEARSHGDLRENAEYHAAREQHGFNEGRIGEIEAKLAQAQVIDVKKLPATGKVVFGTTVDLADIESEEKLRYQIVGEDEADSKSGLISINSPIARALIGKSEGDVVGVKVPGGERELEIVKVQYV